MAGKKKVTHRRSRSRHRVKPVKPVKRVKRVKSPSPKVPMCQATTVTGARCSRPSVTGFAYIERLKCCHLCWQHAGMLGIDLGLKVTKTLGTMHLTTDDYYALYPDEYERYLDGVVKS